MKQNAKWDPTTRPKNLSCRNLKTKGATILRLRKNREQRLQIIHKQKVRKPPDEANKCPSVLRKSVSWQILASFLNILVRAIVLVEKSFFAKINLNTAQIFLPLMKRQQPRNVWYFTYFPRKNEYLLSFFIDFF